MGGRASAKRSTRTRAAKKGARRRTASR
jgi:hypothetical protein